MTKSIITISRQYGTGGRFIGKLLAQKLGVPFYDNEIITLAAKQSGYSESIFEKAEQATTNSLLYSLSMFGSIGGIHDLPLSDKVYIIQSEVITELANKGPCVIIGRCADFVLKERDDVINVFVYSDMKSRIARSVKYYNVPENEAESLLSKRDKKRAAYYNYYTGERWGEMTNYDISLNSDSIGIENCVDVLEKYINARESIKQ